MHQVDWDPDRRTLRQFGWAGLGGFCVIGWLVAWRSGSFSDTGTLTVPLVLWGLALVVWLIGMLAPMALRPLYVVMTLLAWPVGVLLSNLALAVVFFLCVLPLALWFRLVGRDELDRDFQAETSSFWRASPRPRGVASYYRPF